MEDPADDLARLALDRGRPLALLTEEGFERREHRERELPALIVLRRAWLQPDHPGREVDLPPLQGEHLGETPARQVQELEPQPPLVSVRAGILNDRPCSR